MRKSIVVSLLFFSIIALAQTNKNTIEENHSLKLTQDIDHFWDAFDHLKKCSSYQDSVYCFRSMYFEKGTAGFNEFISKYNYKPQDFVNSISKYPKFFKTV